ncbi:hypothetical protein PoB_001703000 [Plakobranchus ocellatus]|uniref:Uncharacterized protein n=1 Tax=Plakobranchus ocellatus TaxID=259542 RepID=A0AAV3Z5U5_9GAST|nr:hypothetical protein PoB_001703000 [Plakobranchus ocellatus]
MAFETEDDFISKLRNWFDNLDVDFFRVGIIINSLLSRWQKCIDLYGDYVEKLWKSELQSVMTLTRFIKKIEQSEDAITGYKAVAAAQSVFSETMEKDLATHLVNLSDMFHGLSQKSSRPMNSG